MRWLTGFLVVWMAGVAIADTPMLVVTSRGAYEAKVVDGVPQPWEKLPHRVLVVSGEIPGPGPDDPNDPPVDDMTRALRDASRATVTSRQNAATLATSLKMLNSSLSGSITADKVKQAVTAVVDVAGSATGAKSEFQAWQKRVESVPGWEYSIPNLQRLEMALTLEFDLPEGAVAVSAAGSDAGEVEGLDFSKITQIIQAILQLLMLLGIIPRS